MFPISHMGSKNNAISRKINTPSAAIIEKNSCNRKLEFKYKFKLNPFLPGAEFSIGETINAICRLFKKTTINHNNAN